MMSMLILLLELLLLALLKPPLLLLLLLLLLLQPPRLLLRLLLPQPLNVRTTRCLSSTGTGDHPQLPTVPKQSSVMAPLEHTWRTPRRCFFKTHDVELPCFCVDLNFFALLCLVLLCIREAQQSEATLHVAHSCFDFDLNCVWTASLYFALLRFS